MVGLGYYDVSLGQLQMVPDDSSDAALKAAFSRGLTVTEVKNNKIGFPYSDNVVDYAYESWVGSSGGSSDSGFSFSDLTKGLTTGLQVAAPLVQTGLAIKQQQDLLKQQQDQLKALQASGRGSSSQAALLQAQIAAMARGTPVPASGTPGWVLPVAIGGGVLFLGLIAVIAMKK